MENFFDSPFKGMTLDKQVTQPNIVVGRFSYYSGYYHGHSFDDCARFILPDKDADKLIVGSFCSIGSGAAFIMAGNQGHRSDWISTFPFFWMPEVLAFDGAQNGFRAAGDTVIGHDVWIGSEAIVMPGVRIGDGAVIATRAVVTRDVEAYTIVGGNPATPIRKRFNDAEISALLEMQWWHWSDEQLHNAMPILCGGDIDRLYDLWNGLRAN